MNKYLALVGAIAVTLAGVLAAVVILAILGINTGRLELAPTRTITVVGQAKEQQANQVARFSASVSKTGESKEVVDAQMREVVDSLVQAAKDFGVPEENIKTEYFNIYQEEMTDYQSGTPTVRKGPWRGNTNISFSKVPADQSTEFSQVLVNTGATSIDGPSFGLDDYDEFNQDLSQQALDNAREKASQLAASQGLKIGKILSVSEAGTAEVMPLMRGYAMGGGGGDFMPGQQEVSASLSVTFELK